jgi:ATP-dependent DNA helicase RecG
MIDEAVTYVMASLRKASVIRGVIREDVPEYPEVAIREAIINAVAHRDYSQFVRGSHIQVRLFADRIEVETREGFMEESLLTDYRMASQQEIGC